MTEKTIDKIGEALFYATFISPFIIVPLIWLLFPKSRKGYKLALGFFLALVISILLFIISMYICFRHGLKVGMPSY
jgi:hypothetical protein